MTSPEESTIGINDQLHHIKDRLQNRIKKGVAIGQAAFIVGKATVPFAHAVLHRAFENKLHQIDQGVEAALITKEKLTKESIPTRAEQIQFLVNRFDDNFTEAQQVLDFLFICEDQINDAHSNIAVSRLFEIYGEYLGSRRWSGESTIGPELVKELLEAVIISCLFVTRRRILLREKKPLNIEKEKRQIEAVVGLRNGFHLHMGTGEGKSTSVLPIIGVIEALISSKQDVILSTVNNTLLTEMYDNTLLLVNEFQEMISSTLKNRFDISIERAEKQEGEGLIDEVLETSMVRDALLGKRYSKTTKEAINERYLHKQAFPHKSRAEMLFEKKNNKPRIKFAHESDLVFAYAENEDFFLREVPHVYMDEIHGPYDRNTAYKETSGKEFFTETEAVHSIYLWTVYFLMKRHLDRQQLTEDDFDLVKGTYVLRAEKEEEMLKNLNLMEQISPALEQDFNEALTLIRKKYLISRKEMRRVNATIRRMFKPGFKHSNQYFLPIKEAQKTALHFLGTFYKEKGRLFVEGPNGEPVVRDEYMDEILSQHKFDPFHDLAAKALMNKFAFIPLQQKAGARMHFQTFIDAMKDKISGLSGTLLFPALVDKKLEQSSLASFLRSVTGKEILQISQTEFKNCPSPELYRTEDEATNRTVHLVKEKIAKREPVLLTCDDRVEGERLFKKLEKACAPASIKFYAPDAESDDSDAVQEEVTNNLANGEYQVVISSGKLGIGVNIMKSDGTVPNLAVIRYGLPLSESKIMQEWGRRRAKGDNFSWVLSDSNLERAISQFESSIHSLDLLNYKETIEEIRAELERVRNNPQELFKFIVKLVAKMRTSRVVDNDFVVGFDRLFNTHIRERAEVLIQRKLEKEALIMQQGREKNGQKPYSQEQLKRWLIKTRAQIGLPEWLYDDIMSQTFWMQKPMNIGGNYTFVGRQTEEVLKTIEYHLFTNIVTENHSINLSYFPFPPWVFHNFLSEADEERLYGAVPNSSTNPSLLQEIIEDWFDASFGRIVQQQEITGDDISLHDVKAVKLTPIVDIKNLDPQRIVGDPNLSKGLEAVHYGSAYRLIFNLNGSRRMVGLADAFLPREVIDIMASELRGKQLLLFRKGDIHYMRSQWN